ncbi:putative 8-oxo-dGTP diphosphatase 3 [Arthrobacter sp. Hiyo4]|nr:putative 8-oxo-dGTP diphosphatase 3 [Arthrobacter sp. Hiyo4]
MPAADVSVLFTSVLDFGYWSYTTVVVLVTAPFEPVISDPESLELQWVPLDEVEAKELHPGFATSWPDLRTRMPPPSPVPSSGP